MRVYLIRHGESQGNAGLSRHPDCELSPLGCRQAAALAEPLAALGVTAILSSPYRRTLQTAEAIRAATGAPAELWPAVHEYHGRPFPPGPWPLGTKSELLRAYPHFAASPEMPETHWAKDGEELPEEWQRVGGAVDQLVRRFGADPQARVAVVTHQGPTYCFIKQFCRLLDPKVITLRIDPGSLTVLELTPNDERVVLCLNWRRELAFEGV